VFPRGAGVKKEEWLWMSLTGVLLAVLAPEI
jgi:hypothetical protein